MFDGRPVADHRTYELIGDEGIAQIHQAVADVIAMRRRLLSQSDKNIYGLPREAIFYDMEKCLGLRLFYPLKKWEVSNWAIVGNQKDFEGLTFLPDDAYQITSSYTIKRGLTKKVFTRRVKSILEKT